MTRFYLIQKRKRLMETSSSCAECINTFWSESSSPSHAFSICAGSSSSKVDGFEAAEDEDEDEPVEDVETFFFGSSVEDRHDEVEVDEVFRCSSRDLQEDVEVVEVFFCSAVEIFF